MIKPIGEALSNKIANLGFVCACLVVPIHIVHPATGWAGWLDRIFAGGVSNVAVPMFFAISGYLLAGHMIGDWWMREVRKRVTTLLIPFFIWNGIALLSGLIIPFYCDFRDGLTLGTTFFAHVDWQRVVIGFFGMDFTDVPFVGALWYIRSLMVFVLLSPMIKMLVDRFGWWWIGFSFVLFAGWRLIECELPNVVNGFFWYGFSLSGLLSFSVGIFLRTRESVVLGRFHITAFAAISFVMLILSWQEVGIWRNVGRVMIIPTFGVLLWSIIPTVRFPKFLVSSAFPIYLMHQIVLGYLQSLPSIIPSPECLAGYCVHVMVPILVSILLSVGIHRFSPKCAGIIWGGR